MTGSRWRQRARESIGAWQGMSVVAPTLWGIPAVVLIVLALVSGAGAARPSVPRFTHVVVVVFENKERDEIVGNSAAPTFAALGARYAAINRYDAVTHPSLPNYLALVSGATQGISSDCTDCVVSASRLADTLAAHGLGWKTYAEGLPAAGFTGASAGEYAKKHDPFLYFRSVLSRLAWRQRVVPFGQLARDVSARQLPAFALVVPNLCDDMHDCPVATGDAWLRREIVPLLSSPAESFSWCSTRARPMSAEAATSSRSRSGRSSVQDPGSTRRRIITACCERSSRGSGCHCSATPPPPLRSRALALARPRPSRARARSSATPVG